MDTKALLSCFFERVPKAFGFLEKDYKFHAVEGFSSFKKGRVVITPPPPDLGTITFPFYATLRYESPDHTIEILYGDFDLSLQCFISYAHRYRFSLDELEHFFSLEHGSTSAPLDLNVLFTTPHHLEKALNALAQKLRDHIDHFLAPPEGFLEHALRHQQESLEQVVEHTHRNEMQQACRDAAKAFQDGKYKQAIMLYRPYKDHLLPDDFRIFSLALMQLDE